MAEVVDSLIDRGRIHRKGGLGKASSELTVAELAIGTNTGTTRNGEVIKPDSTLQSTVLERLYDPISAEVLTSNGETLVSSPGSYAIPAEPFHEHLDRSWIERELSDELDQEIKVSGIKLNIKDTVWRIVSATLSVEGNQLSLETENESRRSYLSNLRQETRKQWFSSEKTSFDQKSGATLPEGSIYPPVLPKNVSGLIISCGLLPEEIPDLRIPKDTCLLNVIPRENDSQTFTVAFADSSSGTVINYAFDIQRMESAILWSSSGYMLTPVTLNWQSTEVFIRVAVPTIGYANDEEMNRLIEVLQDEASVSQDPVLTVLPGFWLEPKEFWSHVFVNFSSFLDIEEKLQYLEHIASGLQKLWGSVSNTLEQSFPLETLKSQLQSTVLRLNENQLSHLINILSNLQSWFSGDVDLLSLLPEPITLEESSKLRMQLISNGIDFDFPSPAYGKHVIDSLLAKFPTLDWLESNSSHNKFEQLLTALASKFIQLHSVSSEPTTSSVYGESQRTRDMEEWWKLFSQLEAFYPVASKALLDKTKELIGEAKNIVFYTSNRDVISFDTNVLVKDGALVDQLLPSDLIVFPRVVMREIDWLKTPKDKNNPVEVESAMKFRVNSRQNLRSMHALPFDSVVVPAGNFDLLRSDEPRDNDGSIISCLIPYVSNSMSVTLVSDDLDLNLRCREYGIAVVSAESYRRTQQEKKRRMTDELRCG